MDKTRFDMKLIMGVKELGLWDKNNFNANSQKMHAAWNKIAKRNKVSGKSRWQCIKKTFFKNVARKETSGIKSVWPYYNHMLFMLDSPHNTDSSIQRNTSAEERDEESSDDEMEESQELPEPEPELAQEPHEMPQAVRQQMPLPITRAISVDSITKEEPEIVRMDKARCTQETTATAAVERFAHMTNITHPPPALYARPADANDGAGQEEHEERPLSWRTIDTDEQFLLSCLTAMKRLPRRRNALVRLQIQQLMFEAEFANDDEAA
uniref:BESS domain-containing protein n=1 Tax=Anopheles maculatus TaxID=74869 RepID=A0A182SP23_9DIPT